MNELKISERFRLICPCGKASWTRCRGCKAIFKRVPCKKESPVRAFFFA